MAGGSNAMRLNPVRWANLKKVFIMFQWIIENKEWVFSGIGVTILIGLFIVFRNIFGKLSLLLNSNIGQTKAIYQNGASAQ
jgi:hypothetical protein